MDFLHSPLTYTRAPRTSRDVCRDACAIEGPAAPAHQGLVYIACAIGAVAVALVLYLN